MFSLAPLQWLVRWKRWWKRWSEQNRFVVVWMSVSSLGSFHSVHYWADVPEPASPHRPCLGRRERLSQHSLLNAPSCQVQCLTLALLVICPSHPSINPCTYVIPIIISFQSPLHYICNSCVRSIHLIVYLSILVHLSCMVWDRCLIRCQNK